MEFHEKKDLSKSMFKLSKSKNTGVGIEVQDMTLALKRILCA